MKPSPKDPLAAVRNSMAGPCRARQRNSILGFALSVLLISPQTVSAETVSAPRNPQAQAVLAPGFTVRDMERSLAFYTGVLGFEKTRDVELAGEQYEHAQGVFGLRMRVVGLKLGNESIELTQYLAPEGRPIPVDSRSNDRWFQHIAIIVSDMDQAYRLLREHNVRHASSGPQRIPDWNTAAAGIQAFYFKDPDGHVLEVLSFPPDKGAAQWHATDRLFLGIDHTAIVVADTEQSTRFYRDALGFQVAGHSENYGTEQEHLNNVFGARLRITSLRAGAGPAIELLEYLAPTDGRPYPADERPNDLVHWQTRIAVRDPEALAGSLLESATQFISAGVVTTDKAELGFRKSLLARDPDGHALQFVQN